MEIAKVWFIVIGFILLLIAALLHIIHNDIVQIKTLLGVQAKNNHGVKSGILQTMSGKIFTVKKKRAVVYNDDHQSWKKEQQEAGEIPYD